MHLRPNTITPEASGEEYIPINFAASVEPMRRADHKAKKHGRPVRLVRYARRVVERECGE